MFSFQMFFSNLSTLYLFLMSATCYALPTLFYDDFDHLTLLENNQIESRIENDETPELFFKNKRQIGKYDPLFFANPANNYRAPAPNIPNFSSQGSSESATYNARPFKSIVIDHVIDHVIDEPPELSNIVEKRQINGRFNSPFFGAANINRAPAPTSSRGSSGSPIAAIALANQLAGATRQPVSWSHGYGR